MKLKELAALFLSFAKIGVMTFGGGYAMLPMFQRELVDNRGWTTEEELTDYYALSQCTPGPIAVNTATFVGQKRCGVPGGISATLGVVFPSVVCITIIAALLSNFAEIPAVKNAFAGVRVCVSVLVINAIVKLWKKAVVDKVSFAVFFAVMLLSVFVDVSPVFFVIGAAIVDVAVKNLEVKR